MCSRHDIEDDAWAVIEPLLPGRRGGHGGVADDNRKFVDAIRYPCETGVAWRDLPHRFGSSNSLWQRCNRWCRTGVRQRIAAALGDEDAEWLATDSSCVRAAPAAAGAREKATARAAGPSRPSAAAAAVSAAGSTRR